MSSTTKLADAAWARRKYEEGASEYSLAEEAGVTRSTVRYWLDRHGVDRRGTGQRRFTDDELEADVRGVADDLGRRPSQNEYNELGEHSHMTVARRFGGGAWTAALDELGL